MNNSYNLKTVSPFDTGVRGKGNKTFNSTYSILFIFLLLLSSCNDWLDINEDPNNPDQANEQLTLAAGISSIAYVYGGRYQVLGALWSQHWTQSLGASQYSGLDSYDINSSTFDNNQYGELYSGALKNFEYIRILALKKQNWNYYLIATVMQCYTFQLLADLYDEIPFSEALKGDENTIAPHFEKGRDIYDSLVVRLDFALSRDFESETVEEVGTEDLLFSGNIDRWKQFANTLKLKIYLREVYARPEAAEAGITGLFSDPDVQFLSSDAAMTQFANETGRANPLYETEIRFLGNNPNLVMSNTLYSCLSDKGDLERLDAMFDFPENGGGHKALIQGNYRDPEEPTGTNSASYSKPVMSPFNPVYLMSLCESDLLQAEAIIRYDVETYSTAKDLYQEAVQASFIRLLLTPTSDPQDIINLAEEFYKPGQPYEFPPEGSPLEEFLETIIMQKWICLAGIQSIETFLEHNRTHFPKVSAVAGNNDDYVPGEFTISVNNVTSGKFPKRLIFPESEYSGNPNTPDKKEVYENIWWDTKVD